MTELEDELQTLRAAMRMVPLDHPQRAALLVYYGKRLNNQYEVTRSITDLNEAVSVGLQAIDATHRDDPDRPKLMGNLANLFGDRYLESRATEDLERAIQINREALTSIPIDVSTKSLLLTNLGNRLEDRFRQTRSVSDLEEAVRSGQEAVALITDYDLCHINILHNFAVRLGTRYSVTRSVPDLEEAIRFERQAISLVPEGSEDRPELLGALGDFLGDIYSRNNSVEDLREAIQVQQRAVDVISENDARQVGVLTNLGINLGTLYSRTGSLSDLKDAIEIGRKAVGVASEDHPDRAKALHNLGSHVTYSYLLTGSEVDMEEAIRLEREAVKITPEDHPSAPMRFRGLSLALGHRYARTGDEADLEEAIWNGREAVNGSLQSHTGLAGDLNNLGARLMDRYARIGVESDLNDAIRLCREAIDATPKGHPRRAGRLNNLSNWLGSKYERTGALSDLGEAIRAAQTAVDETPEEENQTSRSLFLGTLANLFGDRFLRSGAMVDLNEAIRVGQEALDATPKGHVDRAKYLNNLGLRFGDRWSRTGVREDLDKTIHLAQESVEATPRGSIGRANRLNNLQLRLGDRFRLVGDEVDIEEAIQVGREAVDEAHNSQERALILSNLGNRLGERCSLTRSMTDLEEGIRVCEEAIDISPQTRRAELLVNLGNLLGDRYTKTRAAKDFGATTARYQEALRDAHSVAGPRIRAGRRLMLYYADTQQWQRAYEASAVAVPLIPELTFRSLQNTDKQHILSEVVGLASDAAAVALQADKGPSVALSLLEQGRGVMGTSLEEMRADVLELQERHPDLARRLKDLREELQTNLIPHDSLREKHQAAVRQAQSHRRYEAGESLGNLITEIRTQLGFEDFLLAPSEAEMNSAASRGPFVVINVSKFRCDAILIETQGTRVVPLSRLSRQGIEERSHRQLGSPEILEWLWDTIANPVLVALGFTHPPAQNDWPHVWWIPTGPLSKFPIHAAGYHMKHETVLERVMSSYSSSVKAIIHTRRHSAAPCVYNQVLLVGMEYTPGSAVRLPFAPKEIAALHGLCKSMELQPIEPGRRKQNITAYLTQCKIFHFAGHGYTDIIDPSKSHLRLEDEPLTVSDLMDLNLRKHSPFLAYLSACGTGGIKDERFIDESVHLISGCQLAGFRHVIGTLWEVNDELCVEMSQIVYGEIKDGCITDESVCQGLHTASRQLRDKWLATQSGIRPVSDVAQGALTDIEGDDHGLDGHNQAENQLSRDVVLCDDTEGAASLVWVPYVHFGV
ncbi:CHAT domain-containing protein [Dactylonectria estremocensis]|uniref:CHAT domain-containing protein n=1 Tax=Dactylonectria estremocensis TaxID=1079267 RepID=A0A9P9F1Q8_9HYPO|nr:CHAT domain-containing protein [Dactylonectria estremocensis]